MRFTDAERYFVSEASVYRLLKAHDLITSPAFIVMKAADEFKDKTTAPDQLWQTDFTYLKVTGWGWFYLSTVLDDFSRYIVAWKLCTTMKAEDVTDTLELALQASGLDQINGAHRPRLLSDKGPSYVSVELAAWLDKQDMPHIRGAPYHPMTAVPVPRNCARSFVPPARAARCSAIEAYSCKSYVRAAKGQSAAAPPRSAMKLAPSHANCPSRTSLPKRNCVTAKLARQ